MSCSMGLAPNGFSLQSGHSSTGGRPSSDMLPASLQETLYTIRLLGVWTRCLSLDIGGDRVETNDGNSISTKWETRQLDKTTFPRSTFYVPALINNLISVP